MGVINRVVVWERFWKGARIFIWVEWDVHLCFYLVITLFTSNLLVGFQ